MSVYHIINKLTHHGCTQPLRAASICSMGDTLGEMTKHKSACDHQSALQKWKKQQRIQYLMNDIIYKASFSHMVRFQGGKFF